MTINVSNPEKVNSFLGLYTRQFIFHQKTFLSSHASGTGSVLQMNKQNAYIQGRPLHMSGFLFCIFRINSQNAGKGLGFNLIEYLPSHNGVAFDF